MLGAYLSGLEARAQSSQEAALRELEFETSWRACRWQRIGVVQDAGAALRGRMPLWQGIGVGAILLLSSGRSNSPLELNDQHALGL